MEAPRKNDTSGILCRVQGKTGTKIGFWLDDNLTNQEQARQQRIKEEEEKKLKEAEKAKEEAEKAEKGNFLLL